MIIFPDFMSVFKYCIAQIVPVTQLAPRAVKVLSTVDRGQTQAVDKLQDSKGEQSMLPFFLTGKEKFWMPAIPVIFFLMVVIWYILNEWNEHLGQAAFTLFGTTIVISCLCAHLYGITTYPLIHVLVTSGGVYYLWIKKKLNQLDDINEINFQGKIRYVCFPTWLLCLLSFLLSLGVVF